MSNIQCIYTRIFYLRNMVVAVIS